MIEAVVSSNSGAVRDIELYDNVEGKVPCIWATSKWRGLEADIDGLYWRSWWAHIAGNALICTKEQQNITCNVYTLSFSSLSCRKTPELHCSPIQRGKSRACAQYTKAVGTKVLGFSRSNVCSLVKCLLATRSTGVLSFEGEGERCFYNIL